MNLANRSHRTSRHRISVAIALVLAMRMALALPAAAQDAPSPAPLAEATESPSTFRPLYLEEIVVRGNSRTSRDVVLRYLPLAPDQSVTPDRVVDAVASLRESDLFSRLDFRMEKGTERGRVRLVLDVEEKGAEFRFGTGYQDLDGWYLIPAELRLDNRMGRGEQSRLSVKLGYQIAGVEYRFRENRLGADGRMFWGASLGGYGLQRRYFLDDVQYRHAVGRGHLGAHVGRRLGRAWSLEVGARFETVDADSVPDAAEDDEARGLDRGDALPFDQLPAEIAAAVGERRGQVYHVQLAYDARARRRVASTPERGAWGAVRVEGLVREGAEAVSATVDLRAYRAALGGAFAARGRAGFVGDDSAFYDRFHLGGLYTVRGFALQSLSPPGGDTRFWSTTLEFRGPLLGRRDEPRVLGVLFVDAGQGWTDGSPHADDVSSAAGFGFRVRVPWLDTLGFDFGIPLGDREVAETFHASGALGWNF